METVFIYSVNSDELVCLNDGVITGNNDAYDDVVVDVIVEFDYGESSNAYIRKRC